MATPGLTDEQIRQAFDYLDKYGNKQAAADALGISRGAFQNRIRVGINRGYSPDHDMNHIAPEGFGVKGVSTLYGPDGDVKAQWVKTDRDKEQQKVAMEAAIEALSADIPRVEPLPAPINTYSHLCNQYVITDYHMGMLAWHKEGGADWDIRIASDLLEKCFERLVEQAPTAKKCVVAQLGDFLHTDGLLPVTPSHGHILDTDGRFSKIVQASIKVLRKVIDYALLKHDEVHVIMAEGNHDMASSIWLRAMFKALYENEPRVTVNDSEIPYYVYQHGKVMLAYHHGHIKNLHALPLFFATEYPEIWGATVYRYGNTGHKHHKESKEHSGMEVEQHQTLSARDAHASRGGWHANRVMKCTTFHDELGDVGSVNVKPEMFL